MRVLAVVATAWLGLAGSACTPEILPGAYLCGPERACPDDLVCDAVSEACVAPEDARPFVCPTAPLDLEPNDSTDQAGPVPLDGCAGAPIEVVGCIAAGPDVDVYRVDAPAGCAAPRLTAAVRAAIAFAPVRLTAIGDDATTATAMPCAAGLCADLSVPPGGGGFVEVRLAGSETCDGACAHNRYQLDLSVR